MPSQDDDSDGEMITEAEERSRQLKLRRLDAAIAYRLFGWRWFKKKTATWHIFWPPDDPVRSGGYHRWIRWNYSPLLYEEVPGKDWVEDRADDWDNCTDHEDNWKYETMGQEKHGLPHFSTDARLAWTVVEHLQENFGFSYGIWGVPPHSSVQRGERVAFKKGVYPPDRVDKLPGSVILAEADTVSEAICLAAKKAYDSCF